MAHQANRNDARIPAGIRPDTPAARRRRRIARLSISGLVGAAVLAGVLLTRASGEPPRDTDAARPAPQPEAACNAEAPPPARPGRYPRPPDAVIEPGVDLGAIIHTSCGDIELDLLERRAPANVASFVFLARKGFYDGLIWHRVEVNHILQTGDPNGVADEPPNGAGYTVPDEYPNRARAYVYGVVAMANRAPFTNSGSSQFFIVIHKPTIEASGDTEPAGLRAQYSIFGRVSESSTATLDRIEGRPTPDIGDPLRRVKPSVPVYIDSIEITQRSRD